MKSLHSFITRTVCLLVLATVSNLFSFTQAQVTTAYAGAKTATGDIRFIKTEDNLLVFDLQLNNLPSSGALLRITDGDNNVILEQRISSETYGIRYKIEKADIRQLHFEILGKKVFINQSFNIGSKVEERTEVTRV
ncbi:MAG TPA: hypothetical protein PLZ45_04025 [Ferruginibacter sp.]|nr:hypothetical protein [Chitinophagaceae bacterium]HRI23816.1 hypothetical protein [Ferruginibacter sp.]